MEREGWTIDELVAGVATALDRGAYPGAPNGRVRDVPDARAIRWYATIGLVDRPQAMRGRTALYGPRHLLQLVAVKRRQAEGRSLAEIQAELTGAPDDLLAAIADLPELPGVRDQPEPTVARPRKFWSERPAEPNPASPPPAEGRRYGTVPVGALSGVQLENGVVLLVPAAPDQDDVAAIRAAAQPLLDVLAARGLLPNPTPGSAT
jgi:DNA-binding transcriptional MerR regulator